MADRVAIVFCVSDCVAVRPQRSGGERLMWVNLATCAQFLLRRLRYYKCTVWGETRGTISTVQYAPSSKSHD